jgi:hypothetical protein
MSDNGVDWHNEVRSQTYNQDQLDSEERFVLQIRNKMRVEVIDQRTKQVVGEAFRATVTGDWYVGLMNVDQIHNIGVVTSAHLQEVKQRKVILAMLKACFGIE